jgi:hypothetical protein
MRKNKLRVLLDERIPYDRGHYICARMRYKLGQINFITAYTESAILRSICDKEEIYNEM